MPIYEYACRQCNRDFETLVRGDEKPECPHCGSRRLAKKLSVIAAHTSTGAAACPVREAGACGMTGCPGGSCGLTG